MRLRCAAIIGLSELTPKSRLIHTPCCRQYRITTVKCVAEHGDQKAGSLCVGCLPREGTRQGPALPQTQPHCHAMSLHTHAKLPRLFDEANTVLTPNPININKQKLQIF